jgi:hypothetical protein
MVMGATAPHARRQLHVTNALHPAPISQAYSVWARLGETYRTHTRESLKDSCASGAERKTLMENRRQTSDSARSQVCLRRARPGRVPYRRALAVIALCLTVAGNAAAEESAGRIDAVTVYRGQALVTRIVPVPGPAGVREVVVTGLPEHILPGSLHAEGGSGIEVRSVRYRIRPVEQDVRAEVRALDDQIRETQDNLTATERQLQLIAERRNYLDKLGEFSAAAANSELSHGILNADTLEKLSEYLLSQRRAHLEEELKLVREQRDLKDQLDALQRKRNVLTSDSARALREAVVFVSAAADDGELRLGYLVDQATWEPSYSIRAAADRSGARVEYYAAIQQMSGEDWTDVAMTLSTASPSLTAKAPDLDPLAIGLASPRTDQQAARSQDYAQSRRELQLQQQTLQVQRAKSMLQPQAFAKGAPQPPAQMQEQDFDVALNRVAGELQVLDIVAANRGRSGGATVEAEGYSVVYEVAGRTALPSRADQQLIQIAALPLKGEFYKVAIPVLTSYVYEEANLANDSPLVLLAGPVATYVEGHFVGQSSIPDVAAGEQFRVGFGIDSALRATRELLDRREYVQGGNRVVDFKYKLVIENFGAAAAKLRVLDRLPTSKGNEIKVTLVDGGKGLYSKGPQAEADRKKGLLRWDVEVPAQAAGEGAQATEYQFRLEYDRQMAIVGLGSGQ